MEDVELKEVVQLLVDGLQLVVDRWLRRIQLRREDIYFSVSTVYPELSSLKQCCQLAFLIANSHKNSIIKYLNSICKNKS